MSDTAPRTQAASGLVFSALDAGTAGVLGVTIGRNVPLNDALPGAN